ncbi:Ppx/GppA family phosphatase [Actinoallomurus purpureus]|uniref:Ppx/GppA phosphatase family protein n=1 Tax=Actinoallomurus purpureus TaxID=478114 RepID=UPI002092FD54|nr:Ppx/GppA phosphatase family protein [Actinoallomurus purpureus]MCO6009943.1 Ppx/GppA family phosphatase [Actinoallomurus purpureus]
MRLGVLDVGSNTVHLLVVDAHHGAAPLPAFSHKEELRLAAHLEDGDRLSEEGGELLRGFVEEAVRIAEDKGVEKLIGFATSAVREAANGEDVLAKIRAESGVDLQVLSGAEEARLTFLAARRWFGWSAGRLLVLDIGGGSLEIAAGADEDPDFSTSVPLGAGRLTRDWFTADPPPPDEVRALRKYVRATIAREVSGVTRRGTPDHAVATSKTFKQLARITGAVPTSQGPLVRRVLSHQDLTESARRLAEMTVEERAQLPGVSEGRVPQLPAGAIVADAAMDLFNLSEVVICPWALREGVILRHLSTLPEPS